MASAEATIAPDAAAAATPARPGPTPARIGPNAIIQLAAALEERHGWDVCREIFAAAGLSQRLDAPPGAMIPEDEAVALHLALIARLGPDAADEAAWDAGRRTADYLLRRRIPAPAQTLLRHLPFPIAMRLLCRAIAAHAWTFAGGGRFAVRHGSPATIEITGGPLAAGAGVHATMAAYYAATFRRVIEQATGRRLAFGHDVAGSGQDATCRMRAAVAGRGAT